LLNVINNVLVVATHVNNSIGTGTSNTLSPNYCSINVPMLLLNVVQRSVV